MKKTLLLAALALITTGAGAQCVPNTLYADSVYGVWPDTTQNFSGGILGVPYSDTLNILVPSNASLVDSSYPSFVAIDSISLDQVTGLPPGIQVNCNSQTNAPCTYLANHLGCGLLEGTPTQEGTFHLVLHTTVYINFFGAQAVPRNFTGYTITIAPNPAGIGGVDFVDKGSLRNVPNPFTGRTDIEFDLAKATPATVKVYNLLGEQLWSQTIQGKAGNNRVPFKALAMESGIYLYHVEAAGRTLTGRMMVTR